MRKIDCRRQMLETVWALNGTYTDPVSRADGREALIQRIARCRRQVGAARWASTTHRI
jgi:hypothetical protein